MANDIISGAIFSATIGKRVSSNVPKYIRDIKDEAIQVGIKGTRKLRKYLSHVQVRSVFENTVTTQAIGCLQDRIGDNIK